MSTERAWVEFEFIEPCLVSIRIHGKFDADAATEVLDKIEAKVAGKPYFLLESFMTHIDGATPEARRISAERLNSLPDRAIAIVGGSFAQRLLAKLIITATAFLGKGKNTGSFFTDSESARKWLQEYAAQRDAKQASTERGP